MPETAEQLLSASDLVYLQEKHYVFDAAIFGGWVHLIIKDYELPAVYVPRNTNLLLRLPPNFPMAKPDMFWMFPHVRLTNGSYPHTANVFDVQYQGNQWQRWSRHFSNWRPGTDDLRSYLGTIHSELQKGI